VPASLAFKVLIAAIEPYFIMAMAIKAGQEVAEQSLMQITPDWTSLQLLLLS